MPLAYYIVLIVCALLTTFGSVVAARSSGKTRRENGTQHGEVQQRLANVELATTVNTTGLVQVNAEMVRVNTRIDAVPDRVAEAVKTVLAQERA